MWERKIRVIMWTGVTLLLIAYTFVLKNGKDSYERIMEFSNLRTRQELLAFQERDERVTLYRSYLKECGVKDINDIPYDLLQQMVYHNQTIKENVFDVKLYKVATPIDNPTWKDCFELSPKLEYTMVDENSQVPDVIKENLTFGFHSIMMDNSPYIMEVTYTHYDLTDWEVSHMLTQSAKEESNVTH